jgi:hypothetical protein
MWTRRSRTEDEAMNDNQHRTTPAPMRVARRAVILYTLMMRSTVEDNPSHPRANDWLEILPGWLDRLEVGSEIEPYDAEILAAPLGQLDREQRTDARWSGEASGVLGWAPRRVAAPADFDPVDPNKVFDAFGFDPARMVQNAGEFIAGAALRPTAEIVAYYAHVSVVQCCMRGRSSSPELTPFLQKVLRQDLGDLGVEISEADFSAAQEGVARLSDEQHKPLLGNYVVRLHAAEWLAGGRERYWGEASGDADE